MIKFESKEQARAARYPQAPKLPPTKWATEGNMPKYEQAELGPKEGQIRARTFFLKWWTRIGGRLRWPGHYITVKEIYHDGRWSITDEWHDDDDEMSLADILKGRKGCQRKRKRNRNLRIPSCKAKDTSDG
jgi:hypothetical protein